MKKKKGVVKYIITALILIAAVSGGYYLWTLSGFITVTTAEVSRGDVLSVIKDIGTVASGRVSLVTAKSSYEITDFYFQVGDAVEEGATVAITDVKPGGDDVKSLEAQATGIEARLSEARRNTARLSALYDSGAVSKSEYDAAVTEEQGLSSQLSSIRYTISGARNNIQSNLVLAPASGIVTEVFAAKNDTLILGAPLLEISDLSDLYVKAELITDDAAKVNPGDRVVILSNPEISAKVSKIAPKAAESVSDLGIVQKRVEVRIDVDDTSNFILGADMDIQIVIDERRNALVIPKKAAVSIDGNDYVYVVKEDLAELRRVTVGLKGEREYEILEGLSPGERLVVSPDEALADGSKVKEINSRTGEIA